MKQVDLAVLRRWVRDAQTEADKKKAGEENAAWTSRANARIVEQSNGGSPFAAALVRAGFRYAA